MQQSVFDRMLDEIYSAFGRERPKYGSAPYRSLWRRVVEEKHVPDDAAKAIAYALSEYDSLPVNLGKAVSAEYSKWLDRHPELRAKARACAECSADMPGFFWAWDAAGKRTVCKCACNQDEAFDHVQAWTRKFAQQAGLWLHDPFAPQEVQRRSNAYLSTVGRGQEPVRADHARELDWQGAGNW